MPVICNSISVVPYGPDMIETWHTCCFFLPPLVCGPVAEGAVRMRKPGTNTFDRMYFGMMPVTFSADGTAKIGEKVYKKRPHSQKRTFQKVDARDLAGRWCGCCCNPFPLHWPFSPFFYTTRRALNEDQYEESGRSGFLLTLCLPLIPVDPTTYTRVYVNSHPTNGFALDRSNDPKQTLWHRDPGCAGGYTDGSFQFFAKKVG